MKRAMSRIVIPMVKVPAYHQKFIDLATNMANKSDSKFRLGSVLVKKRRVISTGYNDMSKSHPVMLDRRFNPKRTDKSLHAEVAACIGMSPDELRGSDLYVVRILKNGGLAVAQPCSICHRFLTHMGIHLVIFSGVGGSLNLEWL